MLKEVPSVLFRGDTSIFYIVVEDDCVVFDEVKDKCLAEVEQIQSRLKELRQLGAEIEIVKGEANHTYISPHVGYQLYYVVKYKGKIIAPCRGGYARVAQCPDNPDAHNALGLRDAITHIIRRKPILKKK